MNFLDENGLGRLWAQIILKLNSKVPDGGTTGQILKKTETGTEWADAPQTVTIPETTALLKGDGVGGVAAATTDVTPTQGSANPVQSGGVYTALANKLDKTGDGSNVTAAFTAASSRTNIATGEKLSVLFGKIAKWLSDLGSLAFKSTVAKTDLASAVQTSLELADTALQSLPSHNHDASAINSGILPVIRGGTGVSSLDELATALGAARIQTGSYIGTGTYGASNPNSITFNFVPKVLMLFEEVNGYSNRSGDPYIYGESWSAMTAKYPYYTEARELLTKRFVFDLRNVPSSYSYETGLGLIVSYYPKEHYAFENFSSFVKNKLVGTTLYWYSDAGETTKSIMNNSSYQSNFTDLVNGSCQYNRSSTKYFYFAIG